MKQHAILVLMYPRGLKEQSTARPRPPFPTQGLFVHLPDPRSWAHSSPVSPESGSPEDVLLLKRHFSPPLLPLSPSLCSSFSFSFLSQINIYLLQTT